MDTYLEGIVTEFFADLEPEDKIDRERQLYQHVADRAVRASVVIDTKLSTGLSLANPTASLAILRSTKLYADAVVESVVDEVASRAYGLDKDADSRYQLEGLLAILREVKLTEVA